jgi:adenylate cyclase
MRWQVPSQHFWLTALLIAAAVLLRVWDPEPVARLRLSVFDSYLNASPRIADPAMPVKIVDIDAASLQRIGQWPWPRTRIAELVTKLRDAGAKSISLDLILAEPDRVSPGELARLVAGRPELKALADEAAKLPSNDALLADAIAGGRVVLGFVGQDGASQGASLGASLAPPPRASFATAGDDPKLFVPGFSGAAASLPELTAKVAGLGSVNWLPSQDLVVRRVPLLLRAGHQLYPSLALEALRIGTDQTTVQVKASGGSGLSAFGQKTGIEQVKVGPVILPTGANGELWLNFAAYDARRFIPAHLILEGGLPPDAVRERHIFIGASAPGLLDLRATPLQSSVPGVEIHAQALEQMLSGAHLTRPAYATGAELLFLIAVGAGVAFLLRRVGPVIAAIAGLSAVGAVVVLSWLAFTQSGFLFDPVYPSLALVAIYLATSLSTYVKAELDRAYVRQAFGHYVAPQLVEQLAENAGSLKLGGETREVTLLFSDVRGFSRISEGLDAEGLVRFINELFTPIADVILEERGTIDKFMGDAVMAFWNAPVADDNHARHACRAALRMLDAVDELNRQRAARASQTGDLCEPVRIGIGLNTGRCVVGNVGSPQRFDYSILGDVVNIASRLEGETKVYGAPVIVGEATMAQAQDFAFLEIGRVSLRGKDRSERVFALAGDEAMAASAEFAAFRSAHIRLLRALDAVDRGEASKALAEARDLCPVGLGQLLDVYEQRLT